MRNPIPLLSCLTLLFATGLPALAEPRPATQPVNIGLPPEEPGQADIGAVDGPRPECRPVYAPGVRQIGPATATPEQQTLGLVVTGVACDTRR